MKKIQIAKPGGYDKLKVVETEDLSPSGDQVVIEVKAIGVNYADCVIRMGLYQSAKDYVGYPITPGFEVSGRVIKTGSRVQNYHIGQEVLAVTRFGGYATQVLVPENQVFNKPAKMSFEEAAAFPTQFLTAWYALIYLGQVQPNHKVLIHSAAGGVGGALTQIAHLKKAQPVGVVGGPHKVEYVKKLHASAVIDKSHENLWMLAEEHAPGGYDIILDANGVSTLGQSYKHLTPMGRLVIYGFHSMLSKKGHINWIKLAIDYLRTPRFNPIEMTNENKSVMAFNLSYLFEKNDILQQAMKELLDWFDKKELIPPQIKTYPFENIKEAQRDLETAQTVGKLVLVTN